MAQLERATFAGGCFWCLEPAFRATEKIATAQVGFMGGSVPHPTYEQVVSGTTGHREVLQVTFDPDKILYEALVEIFWRQIDPTDTGGQFADRGESYRTAIFYHSPAQQQIAAKSKAALDTSGIYATPIVTEILPAAEFYPAEEYHQQYYLKQPEQYQFYKYGSGRQPYLEKIWANKQSQ